MLINDVEPDSEKGNIISPDTEILAFYLFSKEISISQFLPNIGISEKFVMTNIHDWEGMGDLVTVKLVSE